MTDFIEESFGDFFRRLRRAKGFKSQKSLAESSGVSQTTISRIEDGTQIPTYDTLDLLSYPLRVFTSDLLFLSGQWKEKDLLEPVDKNAMLSDDYWGGKRNSVVMKTEDPHYSGLVKVPVLGTTAAGIPIESIEYCEGYELVESETLRGRHAFSLIVKGDSMIGDGIYNGDTVIIVEQTEVNSKEIALVQINGHEATLKRIKCEKEMCMLIPSNPSMQPTLVPAKDIKILGKVIQSRRNFE